MIRRSTRVQPYVEPFSNEGISHTMWLPGVSHRSPIVKSRSLLDHGEVERVAFVNFVREDVVFYPRNRADILSSVARVFE